jgi:hypothetical protein
LFDGRRVLLSAGYRQRPLAGRNGFGSALELGVGRCQLGPGFEVIGL